MKSTLTYLLLIAGSFMGSSAMAQVGANCMAEVRYYQPTWSNNDAYYVCTARRTIPLNTNLSYSRCVVSASSRAGGGDGEIIINKCLGGGYPQGDNCISSVMRSQPLWAYKDADYVCTARGVIPMGTNRAYTSCVKQQAAVAGPGDGEVVIANCGG